MDVSVKCVVERDLVMVEGCHVQFLEQRHQFPIPAIFCVSWAILLALVREFVSQMATQGSWPA